MNSSKYITRNRLCLASFALVLSLGGCYDTYQAPTDTTTGGNAATGGSDSSPHAGQGDEPGSGGTPDTSGTGGNNATGGNTDTGGSLDLGGAPEMGGSPATGGKQATGGKPEMGGSPATGGNNATGGVSETGGSIGAAGEATGGVESTGGATSGGSVGQGGSAGAPPDTESICVDEEGAAVPYDYSFGLASEYAFELSMNCDVGGYIMPLVLADPEQLSQVNGFVLEATDWYRAEILKCQGEVGPDKTSYGLLPTSQSSDMSEADFDASVELFMAVLDRHDAQPDAVSKQKKEKIKKRIKSIKSHAVKNAVVGLTKTLSEPDCIPAAPAGG